MALKLHQLRDLLAIVEKGSINAAARHLGIAQPALSRSIRELEKDLAVPLFERHSRGATLTPMGALFARRATAAVTELRRARDEIQQLQGSVHGTVVACVSSLSHITLLPHALRPFTERYPNVQLHIVEGVYPMVESRLKNGEIDIYVGPAPEKGPAPELQSEKLFDNTRVVLARRGHPLVHVRRIEELVDSRWITTRITAFDEAELHALFVQRGLPAPCLQLRADTALTWITGVAYTDLLTVSPRQWVDAPFVKQLLVPLPLDITLAAPAIVLVRRSSVPPTPAAEYLCDMLRRAAGEHALQLPG